MFRKILLLTAIISFPFAVCTQAESPERNLREFYEWYTAYPESNSPMKDKEILRFVAPQLIQHFQEDEKNGNGEICCLGYDYFLHLQDMDSNVARNSIYISSPLYLHDKAVNFIALHPFDERMHYVLVLSKKTKEQWKILKTVQISSRHREWTGEKDYVHATKTPQQVVRAFYTWVYKNNKKNPFLDTVAKDFVVSDSIDFFKTSFNGGCYATSKCECCFTTNFYIDRQEKDWIDNMAVSVPLYSFDQAVVAVSSNSKKNDLGAVFVILQRDGTVWKIADIVNAK